MDWLMGIKLLFTGRWNTLKQNEGKNKTSPLSVVEALEGTIRAKDEFIVYLQDELAQLRAEMKADAPERIRKEVDFKSSRGYKSIHTRVREQVLANQSRHRAVPITKEEENYEQVEVE
jgi:hypothetical protein